MSEKGKRATPITVNGAGKATAGNDGKKFSATMLKIASEFEELRKDTEGLQDYEKLLNSQADLRQKLEQKNHEIEGRNREMASIRKEMTETTEFKDRLFREHEARYKVWEADKERHTNDSAELSQLRSELQTSRTAAEGFDCENHVLRKELGQCKEQLKKCQSQNSSLKDQCNLSDLQLKDMWTKLQSCQDDVAALEQKLGTLPLDRKTM